MASHDDSRRWRDEFPQLFAAWLATQTAAHRASSQVRGATAVPWVWTITVLAGGLAVLLGVVSLVLDRPQTASGASERQALLNLGDSRIAPGMLALDVVRLVDHQDWNEDLLNAWTSTSPPIVPASLAVTPDNWITAPQRRALAARAPDPDPYYLRVEPIEFESLTAAVSAADVPSSFAGSEFASNVGVTIDRSSAMLTDDGQLAYTLHVKNLARDGIDNVRVIETLPFAEHVIDTVPPAAMTPDGALVWEVSNLGGFEIRDLTVVLNAAQVTAPLATVAALDVETQVSVKTQVFAAAFPEPAAAEPITPELVLPQQQPEPSTELVSDPISPLPAEVPLPFATGWAPFDPAAPPENAAPIEPLLTNEAVPAEPEETAPFAPIFPEFAPADPFPREIADEPVAPDPVPRPLPIDPAHTPRPILSLAGKAETAVRTGDVVTTVYEIVNTGDAPAEGVVLTVYVPPELRHKHGEQVEHRIERLRPGESHSAKLLTRASSTGTARLDAVLLHDGQAEEHVLSVRVLGPRTAPPRKPQ